MCKINGCAGAAAIKGYCRKHYMRLRRHGDPNKSLPAGRPPLAVPASKETALEMLAGLREYIEPSPRSLGRYQRALRILDQISEISGEDPAELHDQAIIALSKKQGRRAVTPTGLEQYALSRLAVAKVIQEMRPPKGCGGKKRNPIKSAHEQDDDKVAPGKQQSDLFDLT